MLNRDPREFKRTVGKEMEQKTSAVCKSMAEADLEPLVIMMRVLAHPGAGLPRPTSKTRRCRHPKHNPNDIRNDIYKKRPKIDKDHNDDNMKSEEATCKEDQSQRGKPWPERLDREIDRTAVLAQSKESRDPPAMSLPAFPDSVPSTPICKHTMI